MTTRLPKLEFTNQSSLAIRSKCMLPIFLMRQCSHMHMDLAQSSQNRLPAASQLISACQPFQLQVPTTKIEGIDTEGMFISTLIMLFSLTRSIHMNLKTGKPFANISLPTGKRKKTFTLYGMKKEKESNKQVGWKLSHFRFSQKKHDSIDYLKNEVDLKNWKISLPGLAAYPIDLFDYDAEDKLLRQI